MNALIKAILAMVLTGLVAYASASAAPRIKLSSAQVAAITLAVDKASQDGHKTKHCGVVIDDAPSTIEVSFIDADSTASPYQVGTDSKECGYTYVIDESGKRIKRKYYHR